MPPDSASPSAAPRRPTTLLEFFDIVFTAGTPACRCGGPKCPGTLARAAAAQPAADAPTPQAAARDAQQLLETRLEFERELARLINRLGLERHFGNRPDFALARDAWERLENRPDPTPTTDMAAESPKPKTLTGLPPLGWRPLNKPPFTDLYPPVEAKPEKTRAELFAEMNDAAYRLGFRIVDMVPFS